MNAQLLNEFKVVIGVFWGLRDLGTLDCEQDRALAAVLFPAM